MPGLLNRIANTLGNAGTGIGNMLSAAGNAYAPSDLDLTRNQQIGLLGSRLGDMQIGPRGERTNNTPEFLDNIRRDNELARRRGVMDSPQIQGLLGSINDPTFSALIQEQVASGDVPGALNNLFNYNQQQSQKQSMLDMIGGRLRDQGPIDPSNQSLLDMYGAMPDAATIQTAFDERTELDRELDKEAKDRGGDIYDDFKSDIEPFQEILPYYDTIRSATAEPSAAGDLGLIFAYMKMLDPGSVVREGEFAVAANSGGIPDRVRRQIQNAQTGERLSKAVRLNFAQVAQRELENRRKTYDNALEIAYGKADSLGVDRNYVLPIDLSYDTSLGEDGKTLPIIEGDDTAQGGVDLTWAETAVRVNGPIAQTILDQKERYPNDPQRALEEATAILGYPRTLTEDDASIFIDGVSAALDALEANQ